MPVTITTKVLNYNNKTEYKTIDAISPPIGEGEYMPSDAGITGAHAGDVIYISAVDEQGRPIEYSSTPVFHTMTVHVVNSNGDYIQNVPIRIRHNVLEGEVYVAGVTTNQPLSFSLPSGFSYYIEFPEASELGEYFDVQCFNQEGIVQHSNLTCNIIYSGIMEIKTASDIKRALDNNIDLTDFVGESITCTKGDEILTWDIVDYDATIPQVTLMCHNVVAKDMAFNTNPQAIYYAHAGLAAGNYKLKGGSAAYTYFTLTQAIPEGGQLVVDFSSNRVFKTYASTTAIQPIETGSTTAEELLNATDLGTAGTGLLNHFYRCNYTSNNYAESGIRVWLNSDAEAGEIVASGQTSVSRPYIVAMAGFLNDLDEEFLSAVDPATWLCNTNNIYEYPLGHYSTASKYGVYEVFSLPSVQEIFGVEKGVGDDSTQFGLFENASAEDLIRYDNTGAPCAYWLRTPDENTSHKSYYVTETGILHETSVYNSTNAIVPIVKIGAPTV